MQSQNGLLALYHGHVQIHKRLFSHNGLLSEETQNMFEQMHNPDTW